VYFAHPLKGLRLELVIGAGRGSEESTRMMGLPDGRKSFNIGLAVLIQCRRVTDTQPRRPSKDRAYVMYVALVKTQISISIISVDYNI